jgi:hypothetical protein
MLGLWLCAVVLIGVTMFPTGGMTTAQTDDDKDATIEALQTENAELQASVESRNDKIEQLRTRIATLESGGDEPAPTPKKEEASAEGASSPFLGGNALELLPGGEDGELGVARVGIYDGNILPVIIRNNTDQEMSDIKVSAVARTADGELIAAGGDQGFQPNRVAAGSYTLGYIYFDGITLPADAAFEFEVDGENYTGDDSFSRIDLEVKDAAYLGDRIVGEFTNRSEVSVAGPIGISVMCFDGAGNILGYGQGYSDKEEAVPGDDVPFQVSLYGGFDCTNFLVAGSGWNL